MGCCLGVFLLGGAPRLALLLWWFMDPARIAGTFRGWSTTAGSFTAPHWMWPAAGLLLLPWTTLAYIFVSPGGITTFGWAIIVIGLLLDLSAHGGSGREYHRRRSER